MEGQTTVKDKRDVVIRFSGDSGDGMQLTGTIFTDLSAMLGNTISTFPDFPAEIRAPQGSLSGVSGFQVHIGPNSVKAPGDLADVLVAMNPAALKVNKKHLKRDSLIIIDLDSFGANDLKKAEFTTDDPFVELGLNSQQVIAAPISSMVKEGLSEFGLDNKSAVRCKNMFALGLICWLFERPMEHAEAFLDRKFGKKPQLCEANKKALHDGFNYGANTHASTTTYRVETSVQQAGKYIDINGNKATSFGLIAASERSGRPLFLGSYPITPATDILHELSKHKSLGVKTVQAEDEIADLMQALYGRNGESPMPVIAGITPDHCFTAAYWAAKIAIEHMTPVILLTDSFIANGSSAFRIPDLDALPPIKPNYISLRPESDKPWKPYERNEETLVRYWALPGEEGYQHRLGGLEKDSVTSAISTDADNHERMVALRAEKVARIADSIPLLEVEGDEDSDLLIVGWGCTYGHLYESLQAMRSSGYKVALAHFAFINPLPRNAEEILRRYKKVVVVEQNTGQFAGYLRAQFPGFMPHQYNRVTGQPFTVHELVDCFTKLIEK